MDPQNKNVYVLFVLCHTILCTFLKVVYVFLYIKPLKKCMWFLESDLWLNQKLNSDTTGGWRYIHVPVLNHNSYLFQFYFCLDIGLSDISNSLECNHNVGTQLEFFFKFSIFFLVRVSNMGMTDQSIRMQAPNYNSSLGQVLRGESVTTCTRSMALFCLSILFGSVFLRLWKAIGMINSDRVP